MCELCGDVGWVYILSEDTDGLWQKGNTRSAKVVRCVCKEQEAKESAQKRLEALDGLTQAERGHRFETTTPHPTQILVRDGLKNAFTGIYVLEGAPGIGKSHFLHATVNQAREQGRVSIYTTLPDVLDYLRAAFNPRLEESYEERWQLLIACEVLAIDELDEFNSTPWAHERFLRLIDERWRKRDEVLTVVALNGEAKLLIPKVASRLIQGTVYKMKAPNMRALLKQQPAAHGKVPA